MRFVIILGFLSSLSGLCLGWLLSSERKMASVKEDGANSALMESSDRMSILPEPAGSELDPDLKAKLLLAIEGGVAEGPFAVSLASQVSASMDPDYVAKHLTESAWIRDPMAVELAFSVFAEMEPMAAYALAKGLPDQAMRARFLALAIDTIGRNDYNQGLALLEESVFKLRRPPPFLLSNPVAAAAFYEKLHSSPLRSDLLDALPIAWAGKDPAAAMDWSRAQDMSGYQQRGLMKAWARQDLGSMTDYLTAMPDSRDKTRISGEVAGAVLESEGIESAMTWIHAKIPLESVPEVLTDALRVLVDVDPENAMTLAIREGADAEELIQTWAYRDGHAAMSWAAEIEDPVLAETLVQRALQRWATQDPAAAAAQVDFWIESGQPVPSETINKIGGLWNKRDPEAVIEWATALREPEQASKAIDQALGKLLDKDPSRALDYVELVPASSIGDGTVNAIHRHLRKNVSLEHADGWVHRVEERREERPGKVDP